VVLPAELLISKKRFRLGQDLLRLVHISMTCSEKEEEKRHARGSVAFLL
jgi:hypothetical protein